MSTAWMLKSLGDRATVQHVAAWLATIELSGGIFRIRGEYAADEREKSLIALDGAVEQFVEAVEAGLADKFRTIAGQDARDWFGTTLTTSKKLQRLLWALHEVLSERPEAWLTESQRHELDSLVNELHDRADSLDGVAKTLPAVGADEVEQPPTKETFRTYRTLEDGTRVRIPNRAWGEIAIAKGEASEFIVGENHGESLGKIFRALWPELVESAVLRELAGELLSDIEFVRRWWGWVKRAPPGTHADWRHLAHWVGIDAPKDVTDEWIDGELLPALTAKKQREDEAASKSAAAVENQSPPKTPTPAVAPPTGAAQHPDGPEDPYWLWWKGKRHKVGTNRAKQIHDLLKYFWSRDSETFEELIGEGKPWVDPVADNAFSVAATRFNNEMPKGFPWKLRTDGRRMYREFS